MRVLLWLTALAVPAAGCSKTDPLYCTAEHHLDDVAICGAQPVVDAPVVPVDSTALNCLGPSGTKFEVCLGATLPTRDVVLPMELNTDVDADPLCAAAGSEPTWSGANDACFVVAGTIASNPTVPTNVHGSRPLVLIAATTITISNALHTESSRTLATVGPGANPATCAASTGGATIPTMGSGGGGGGGFQTAGGAGGAGNLTGSVAVGGLAGGTSSPAQLHGGCPGAAGGGPTGSVGAAGAGGGAVYLVAGTSITISNTISVSGAGGAAGTALAGGSGGGSGGMVALFAPAIDNTTGVIMANGGGGSGGGDGGGSPGGSGGDPALPFVSAGAGGGGGAGGTGGRGYALTMDAQPGVSVNSQNRNGGGGGGGAGYVLSNKTLAGMVSPAIRGF